MKKKAPKARVAVDLSVPFVCSQCGKESKGHRARKYCWDCLSIRQKESKERIRERGRAAIGDGCFFCGGRKEHIHHLDMNTKNNVKENLIPLCSPCHVKVHSVILRPFIKSMIFSLRKERYSVIKISTFIGITRQRIYQILKK